MEQKHDNGLVSNCIGNNELQDLTAWIVLVPGTVVAVVSLLRSMSLIKKNVLKLCAQLESVVSFARCSTQYLYISSGNEMTVRLALTALVTADFTTPVHAYSQRSVFLWHNLSLFWWLKSFRMHFLLPCTCIREVDMMINCPSSLLNQVFICC